MYRYVRRGSYYSFHVWVCHERELLFFPCMGMSGEGAFHVWVCHERELLFFPCMGMSGEGAIILSMYGYVMRGSYLLPIADDIAGSS